MTTRHLARMAAAVLLAAANLHASLVGDEITANGLILDVVFASHTETVLEGPEAIGNWLGEIGYDLEASTITVSSLVDQESGASWVCGISFEFLDLDWVDFPDGEIVGVHVTSATGAGWSNIDDSDLSFTAHSVTIDASEIGDVQVAPDQSVSIEIVTSHVRCPWDLDGDDNVGITDLLLLLMDFGSCDGSPADFDDDECVTFVDLLTLLFNFGPCPDGRCPWDVDGDRTVDHSDLFQVLRNLGPCGTPAECPEDVNGVGVVDFEDVIAVATHFGTCP